MAPEVMEQAGGYDFRADIWSMGIAALELAKGVAPYAHLSAMRVLVLTIEEPPPSLKAYPNDRQRDGAPFSCNFDDFYKKCLQKNPRLRPSTEELLKHKFLKNRSCYALVDQLLKHIPSVGRSIPTRPSGEEQRRRLLPGEGPVAIELIERKSVTDTDVDGMSSIGSASSSSTSGDFSGKDCVSPSGSTLRSSVPCSPSGLPQSPSRDYNRNPPAAPVYVSGTTWVFDGDGDNDEDHPGMSGGEMSRILRISSRVPGKSGGVTNGQSYSMSSHSSSHSSSSSSSSSAKHEDYHNNNGIDSFLADFEADAATIKSTKTVVVVPPTAVVAPTVESKISAMTISPILPTDKELPEKNVDNDAFMDEMEGICD